MDLPVKMYTPLPLSALKSTLKILHYWGFSVSSTNSQCLCIQYQQIMGLLCRTGKWVERWHHWTWELLWFLLHPTVPKHGKIVCEHTWNTQSTIVNFLHNHSIENLKTILNRHHKPLVSLLYSHTWWLWLWHLLATLLMSDRLSDYYYCQTGWLHRMAQR